MTGERTGVAYSLGDKVRVRVLRVNMGEAKVDFALATDQPERPPARGRRKKPE
jgi:ribonuclease R